MIERHSSRLAALVAACAATLVLAACHHASKMALPAAGSMPADQFLYERGQAELKLKHWLTAREYLQRLVTTYPQSQYRAEAKLGVADSYLGEKRIDSDILGVSQYKEFLQFFPTNPKADYAQYQICVGDARQMLSPERDQSATLETIKQIEVFLSTFPTSPYVSEVKALQRQAQNHLSEHEYDVGLFQYRVRAYQGAVLRFEYLLKQDPEYPNRDLVYYYMGESLMAMNLQAAAVPYYTKLLAEFPKSKFAAAAQKRLAAIKH